KMKRKSISKRAIVYLLVSTVFEGSTQAVSTSNIQMIARLSGPTPPGESLPNPNHTHTRWVIARTDLGILSVKGGGEHFIAFGDTNNAAGQWNRSNVLAVSSDTNLEDGLTFSRMIESHSGFAKEILYSKKINNDEMTVIPTAGVTVGNRHYIHYMSVNHW